jgi:fibronectin-binding autotransporter adhesin
MRSGSSPASVAPRQIVGAPSHLHARLRSTASGLTLATAALACAVEPARAACTPTLTPTTGQTVTCDSSQPNPVTTGVVAQPGSTNVTVNMLSGAQLNVGGGDAVVLGGGGQVTNNSGAIIQGVRGVNITGAATVTNSGQIGGTGGPGVIFGGAGNSVLTNMGQIGGSGAAAVQFNTVAGSSQTFNNTGNGSINGNFVGSGDGQITIVNGGNFNGGITISGNGVNNITTQQGRNINGQVSITGNAQTTIFNGGAFNNGLVISGAGINSITNQPGAFINQTFSVTGSQNTIDNASSLNNGLVVAGGGINTVTNRTGAFINQIFSVTGSQNTIDNFGTLNNGLTVAGGGVNTVTNRAGATINQTFSVTGSQNTVTNAGTLNNGLTVGNGVNSVTNQSGGTVNQTFSVTGSQNTISNAGTVNSSITVSGDGTNSITNTFGGVINQAVNVSGAAQSTITNIGTMAGGIRLTGGSSTITNFGTINQGVFSSGSGSLYNSGTITASGANAIDFTVSPGTGPFTLTLAPGFNISGNVLGNGSDTFQLGDSQILKTLLGTFNVSTIGPAQQYRGFSVFNKIGASVWALTGTGAQNWNISGGTLIGDTNSLQGPAITNNAELVFNQAFAGTYAGSIGGAGAVTVRGGGTVIFTGANTYTGGTTIDAATLQLGNGGASGSIVGDVMDNGTLAINRSDTFTFANAISGTGAFVQAGPGTTILTANNSYSGPTTVAAGTLRVSGSIAGSSGVTVNAGATLGGTGTVTGRVASTTINNGGTLAPGDNAVGALVVAGNLVFQSAAQYLVEVSPTAASTTLVSGSTTVAGTLTANDLGGTYTTNRIFPVLTSTGALTGTFSSLLQIGSFTGATSVSLAYSPHEVFLIITTGAPPPPAWSGTAVAGPNNWHTPATNWTTGTVPTNTDVAQFNTSATTTINIQQLNTQVGGLQFNAGAPAYTFNITGTSGVPSSLVIQGDGVADISGNAPTFVVSGVSGALGTLQFNNASTADDAIIITNAFGQTIFSGTSTGAVARFITNAGGVVDFSGTSGPAGNNRVTAGSIEGAGTYNLGANTLIVGLNNLSTTVSGTINDGGMSGGAGASLVKVGDGTLILTGANTYTGLTAVLGGTLQLGNGGASGSILGNVFLHTTLAVNRSDTYTFGGIIVGDGAFVQMGSGTTILTANNLYLGGTTISAGALQLGNGGTSGGIVGDVLDNGTLAVNRSDTLTLRGIISGTGAFQQNGTGTTVLTGDNLYTGGTTINAGMLQLGDGGASGSITGNVTDNGIFAVNRSDTYTFGGVISGNGAFAQIGPGTTILTAANAYSGGTIINAGVLAVAADANLGAATGGLAFGGGTLRFLSGFATNRAVTLDVGGGTIDTNGNTATLAGSIGGPGGLTKIGAGTLVLSGINSYSGGTALAAGTLRLENNSALGTGALTTTGSVVDYANGVAIANSIVLDSNSTQLQVSTGGATQAGAISELNGPRPLEKIGDGTLFLTGAGSYTGPTTVSAGALVVNGSIANSSVTVNAGALLAGTGIVGATTIAGGATFAPGSGIPGSSMTVAGNLAFQSGALYVVQINPSSASSASVIAGGNATLAGTVNAAFASGSYVSRTYTILSAIGGLGGTTFNGLTTSNLPAGFTANLSYTDSDVILNLIATLGQPSGPGALGTTSLSQNQRNVANALNNFFNSGGALPPAFVSVFGLTGGNLANALSQLSGEAATGAQQVGFQMGNQFLSLMLDPFVDGRSGVAGTSGPALGFAPEQETRPDDVALAYSSVLKAPSKPPLFEQRWSVWGGAYGGGNRTSGDPAVVGSHDLSASTAGFAGGFDYRVAPNAVLGLAFAGGGTNWSLAQGLGGGRSDAFQAGLYGATRWGPAYLAAALAYTNHWMSTDRFAFAGDHLTASFNAQSFGGRLEGGYRFATMFGGITPYAAIQAQSFHTPAYTETDVNGGGFALAYNARTGTDTRSELGARFDRVLALYTNAVLSLRGRLAWAHDWVSDPTLAPVFQTLPGASFIVNGAAPAKNSALVSAGTELRLTNGVSLIGKFDGEFAAHSTTYAGTGTIRYAW